MQHSFLLWEICGQRYIAATIKDGPEMGTASRPLLLSHHSNRCRRTVLERGRKSRNSNHFCLTPSQMKPSPDLYRTCHFTDVCFNRTGTMLYFIGDEGNSNGIGNPKNNITNSLGQTIDLSTFTEELKTQMQVQALMKCPNKQCEASESYLVPHLVSSGSFEKVWSPVDVAIPYFPHNEDNFGHALADNVYSFYKHLQLFGLYDDTARVLPLRMDCKIRSCRPRSNSAYSKVLDVFLSPLTWNNDHTSSEGGNNSLNKRDSPKTNRNDGNFPAYFEMITNAAKQVSVQSQNGNTNLVKNSNNEKNGAVVCFSNVLSGRYFMHSHGDNEDFYGHRVNKGNPALIQRGDDITRFRGDFMRRMRIDEDSDLRYHCPSSCRETTKETELNEQVRNSIGDEKETVVDKKEKLTGADVIVIPRQINTKSVGKTKVGWDHEGLVRHCQIQHNISAKIFDASLLHVAVGVRCHA